MSAQLDSSHWVPELRSLVIPVAPGKNAYIDWWVPMSESEWAQFMAVLEAMKPALIRDRYSITTVTP